MKDMKKMVEENLERTEVDNQKLVNKQKIKQKLESLGFRTNNLDSLLKKLVRNNVLRRKYDEDREEYLYESLV